MLKVGGFGLLCGIALGSIAHASSDTPPEFFGEPPPELTASKARFRPYLSGSSVAVDLQSGEVFVADSDNDSVAVSDPTGRHVLRVIPVGSGPEQLVIAPDGRVFVSLRGSGEVVTIEPRAAAVGARMHVGDEPFGLALAPDGKTLFVSLIQSAEVVGLASPSLAERFRLQVDADPRGMAVTPDGETLFVAHLTGRNVSAVDLAHLSRGAQAIRRIPLIADDSGELVLPKKGRIPNLTFALAMSPSGRQLYVPHVLEDTGRDVAPEARAGSYGAGAANPIEATLSVIDADAAELVSEPDVAFRRDHDLSQPRAIAIDPLRNLLYVAGQGSDAIQRYITRPHGAPIALNRLLLGEGDGPKGLAVSADGKYLYAHAALKHQLDVIEIDPHPQVRRRSPTTVRLTVGPERLPAAAVHGRKIFFAASDTRVSADHQFACASCHPDGRQDGMVWRLDRGPRQTPVLAGRLVGTAPYNWLGGGRTLRKNMQDTMRRLGGTGLSQRDLGDLELYLTKYLQPVPRLTHAPNALAEQGRALFESDEVGCAHCHTPGSHFTDGKNHDIGSTTDEEVARILADAGRPTVLPAEAIMSRIAAGTIPWYTTTGALRLLGGRTDPPMDAETFGRRLQVQLAPVRTSRDKVFVRESSLLANNLPFVPRTSRRPRKATPPVTRLAYNTPSLIGVGASAPYLHDGSAANLRELLTTANPGDRMGRTSQLEPQQVDALVAYLETL